MSNITLIHGNCVDEMKKMVDDSIDLTVTSPPYDNLRRYNGNISLWSEDVWKSVISELFRTTKVGGVVVWVVGDATIKGSETGTSFRQALYFKDVGFNLHDTMIWEKTGQGAVGSNYCYWQNFEYMFIFSKGKPKSFNPICDRENKIIGKQKTSGGRNKDGVSTCTREIVTHQFGRRFNNWRINQDTKQEHPAVFPESLARDHIISWSNEGDTVFDPFMGSGTTGKMAKLLNRRFIGVELDISYFNLAISRINNTH